MLLSRRCSSDVGYKHRLKQLCFFILFITHSHSYRTSSDLVQVLHRQVDARNTVIE